MVGSEAVRLVVWDLDDTFWNGTLAEDGIAYRDDCHAIVLALTDRGIINSICSKNAIEAVRPILESRGIWDHFVFPSIDWTAKGPRIARLIAAAQLRPASVLFIDDNPANLNEARHFVPELQLADPSIIATMLDDPRFAGTGDPDRTRLSRYKLLEQRKSDAAGDGHDNWDFLRESGIRVELEYDVAAHADRAVELINRTNQINFTKVRLPEDPARARAELLNLCNGFDIQAALVRVSDKYGDHGFCGIYVVRNRPSSSRLIHFAFSCRILHMGVEQWLYRRLGRPGFRLEGPVASDPTDPRLPCDWISIGSPRTGSARNKAHVADTVYIRGGCDLSAIGHYFATSAGTVIAEHNIMRAGVDLRLDHSCVMRLIRDGVPDRAMGSLARLAYRPGDFVTAARTLPAGAVAVLGFSVDASLAIYRHRQHGFRVAWRNPKSLPGIGSTPVHAFGAEDLAVLPPDCADRRAIAELVENYECEGRIGRTEFCANMRATLDPLRACRRIFVIGANEFWRNAKGKMVHFANLAQINAWSRATLASYPNARFIDAHDFIQSEEELESVLHYRRDVYYRIYRHIAVRCGDACEEGT